MKSETTIIGILQFLAVIITQLTYHFDNDPLTVVSWGVIAASVTAFIALWRTRDNNKTSEQAGAAK